MAQPWKSPHNNTSDTKAVMDGILGNLNRELAALSTASRDLLESSQPKSSQQPVSNHANSTYEHKSIRPPSTSTSTNPVTASIQPMSLNNSSSLNTSSQSNQSNQSNQPHSNGPNQTFNSNAMPNRTSPPSQQVNSNQPIRTGHSGGSVRVNNVTMVPDPQNTPPKSSANSDFPPAPPPTRTVSVKTSSDGGFPAPPPNMNHGINVEPNQDLSSSRHNSSRRSNGPNAGTGSFRMPNLDEIMDGLEVEAPSMALTQTDSVLRNQTTQSVSSIREPESRPVQVAQENNKPIGKPFQKAAFQLDDVTDSLADLENSINQGNSNASPIKSHSQTSMPPPISPKPPINTAPNLTPPKTIAQPQNTLPSHSSPVSSNNNSSTPGIKAYGPNMYTANLNQPAEFFVDLKNAGSGKLSGGMVGPADAGIKMEELPENLFKIGYLPTEPGQYTITLKFENNDIPGSPFDITVEGKRDPTKLQDNEKAVVGRILNFGLKLPRIDFESLTASVENPDGSTARMGIDNIAEGNYNIKFRPEMVGVHRLNILHWVGFLEKNFRKKILKKKSKFFFQKKFQKTTPSP